MRLQANSSESARTNTEDRSIDCVARASAALAAVTADVGGPCSGPAARLAAVLRDITRIKHERNPNATAMRAGYELAVAGTIDDLYDPVSDDDERVARRIESDMDRAEDGVQDLLGIEGESAYLIEEHAKKLDQQAAASRHLARVLRAKARRMRREREQAIAITKERFAQFARQDEVAR